MVGVLAGIEDASDLDLRRCEHFVGTSAGSIVAARLSAGVALERPQAPEPAEQPAPEGDADGDQPGDSAAPTRELRADLAAGATRAARSAGDWALALSSPLAPIALRLAQPAGSLTRAALLRAAPRPHRSLDDLHASIGRLRASFDGRLRVVAVQRATGRRIVFGRPRAPTATVADAVEASCAMPWMFEPVRIGGVDYVDGAVWSPTNLDAAPAGRGTHVLCLNPTAGLAGPHALFTLMRRTSRSAMILEAQALRAKGAEVRLIEPDDRCVAAIGQDLMARARRLGVLREGYRQGLSLRGR
jgi:NTE family protein